MGPRADPTPAATPPATAEVIHESPDARVSRLLLPEGSVIRKEPLGPGRRRRLRHEREVLRRLVGVPGVAQLADLPQPPDSILLADVHAAPLTTRTPPWELAAVCQLGLELARTLAAVHARGVVHGDITPSNILLTGDGSRPYLVDFAHATAGEIRPEPAGHRETVAALPYLAPEQTGRTARPADHRVDLYALGATLYELATGAPPFSSEDPLRLIRDILTLVPEPPAERDPTVGTALSDVLMRLLSKEPDNRYQSAAALVGDLVRVRGERPEGMPAPAVATAPAVAAAPAVRARPLSPLRLVGRDEEIDALASAFARALDGDQRGVLITGPTGVGKTSMLNELRLVAAARDGWFVPGVFDRYRRDLETNALWQAYRALGRLLLAEPEERLTTVRHRLHRAIGPEAALLARVQPELAAVMRLEPDHPPADPASLQAWWELIAVETLRAVLDTGRPVVLALDDLQWAPPESLGIVDRIMSEHRLDGLLVAVAYQPDAVAATGPATEMLTRWQQQAGVTRVTLSDLPLASLATMVAEMLELPAGEAGELAGLLRSETGGNPYRTVELLRVLADDGLLRPDGDRWRWDSSMLRRRLGRTDTADLLARRSAAVPESAQELLQIIALLGGTVERDLLQDATGLAGGKLDQRLQPALAEGLLLAGPDNGSVHFYHDLVRESVLSGMEPSRRHARQLTLARRLATRPDRCDIAAEQYLPVVEAVRRPQERHEVVALLRRAAERAQSVGGHLPAQRYLAAAVELVDPADTSTLIALLTGQHAALYHLGRLDEADLLFQRLAQLDPTPAERTDATLTQISSLTNRNRPAQAIQLGLELLAQLGHPAPATEHLDEVIDRDLDDLYRWVDDGHGPERTVRPETGRPEITDPTTLAAGAVFNRLVAPAYLHDQTLLAWLVLRAWRIWAHDGPGRTLVSPLCSLVHVTAGRRGDYRTGYRIMQQVMAASHARGYEPETSQARLLYALGAWRLEPLEKCVRLGRQAQEGLLASGDLQNACFTHYATTVNLLDLEPLETYASELDAGIAFVRRAGSEQVAEVLEIYRRLAALLRRETPQATVSAIGSPEAYRANPPAVASVRMARAVAAMQFGDWTELETQTSALMALLPAITGTYAAAATQMMRALALAERTRATTPGERAAALAELDRVIGEVAVMAADSPANFLHLLRLLEAERAWAVDDFRGAALAFDSAAQAVAHRQRPWHRAFILERVARFSLSHGMQRIGHGLMADARRAYVAAGATAKVDQLDWAYPAAPAALATGPGIGLDHPGRTTADRALLTTGAVDLAAILAASRALSSETSINGLRQRLDEVLSTLTGATSVQLLLWNDDHDAWLLTVPTDDNRAATVPLDEAGPQGLVPVSAVRYVERTGDPLVVGDATLDDRFRRDPYLSNLERCALLVAPIRGRAGAPAMLVLENQLIGGAFTAERLDAVTMIAGQLAVSLENAMAFAMQERTVAERTAELAHANRRLELLSVTDSLTAMPNRRRLENVLGLEWNRAYRTRKPLALAMVDIDHFKDYNDHFGHVAGDRCLRRVAALLQQHVRGADLAARYGGEEFVVVMPGADLDAARSVAERLRTGVAAMREPHPVTPEGVVTVSVGVAATIPRVTDRPGQLVTQADAALYRAKQAGRNRVMPVAATTGTTSAPGGAA
jgi:diguanylate cyclase (GGDEF)-like protein